MASRRGNRAAVAKWTARGAKKKAAGRAGALLDVRMSGVDVEDEVLAGMQDRLIAKLGKFADNIRRVMVTFASPRGARAALGTVCTVKVMLNAQDYVVYEASAPEAPAAMTRAGTGVERAVREALGRPAEVTTDDGSLIGRRVGQGRKNLEAALERPEKRRRDQPVDTSRPKTSASDRRAGGGSTARRNTKRASDASVALEDSARARPSRRSTRKGANRVKPASNLQRRQIRKISSPKARASRS